MSHTQGDGKYKWGDYRGITGKRLYCKNETDARSYQSRNGCAAVQASNGDGNWDRLVADRYVIEVTTGDSRHFGPLYGWTIGGG
jgi:hypothetical protein